MYGYYPGYIGRGYYGNRGCGCRSACNCMNTNFYRWPKPEPKRMRRLDTTQIVVHTDKFVGERCVPGPCCEPITVKVEEKVKSFILRAATECLEPCTYYTLDIDHPLPDGIFAAPTFIQVERCGLFQDPVKLVYTETEFPLHMFDGRPHVGCALPADPAFPNENLINGIGLENEALVKEGPLYGPLALPRNMMRNEETRLIPVELDLHGNTAFGDNFVKGIGPHPATPLVLFYTNRATFSLARTWRRRTDY